MSKPEYNEEIYFKEYIQIIIKHKVAVLGSIIIVLISTIIASFIMSPVYEVKAVIQNGFIDAPIITYAEASALLESRSFLKPVFEKSGVEFPEKRIKKMIFVENIKDTKFFILKIRHSNKELVYQLAQDIIKEYINYGQSLYNTQNILMKNQLIILDNLIEKTKASLEKTEKYSVSVPKDNSMQISFPDQKVQLRDLFTQKFQMEFQLTTAKEFMLIDEPVKPKSPILPNKKLLYTGFSIIGLILGVFCAFFMESWEKQD